MLFNPFQSQIGRAIRLMVLAALLMSTATGYSSTALYCFGDSLTDTSRNPANSNFYKGRFSNGPLWVEYLSSRLGITFKTNNNMALAGSTTTNLLTQVAAIPASTNLQSALSTMWSGANDFAASQAGTNDAAWGVVISNAVMNITNAIGMLYTSSAREIILGDLFNLTLTPLYSVIASNSYSSNYAVLKVLQFNSELGTAVTNLMQSSQGLRIYFMDVYRGGRPFTIRRQRMVSR